jgi:hypothetical protein
MSEDSYLLLFVAIVHMRNNVARDQVVRQPRNECTRSSSYSGAFTQSPEPDAKDLENLFR